MMAADALRCTVPSGVSLCWLSPRRRACSARAFAPHFALPAAPPGRKCRSDSVGQRRKAR